jgi:hypothetical protein
MSALSGDKANWSVNFAYLSRPLVRRRCHGAAGTDAPTQHPRQAQQRTAAAHRACITTDSADYFAFSTKNGIA